MMQQIEAMSVSEIRGTIARVVREDPVPEDVGRAARESLWATLQEASLYGLTQADVLKAVLRPAFEKETRLRLPGVQAPPPRGWEQEPSGRVRGLVESWVKGKGG